MKKEHWITITNTPFTRTAGESEGESAEKNKIAKVKIVNIEIRAKNIKYNIMKTVFDFLSNNE